MRWTTFSSAESPLTEPAGDTHSRFLRWHDFMPEISSEETNDRAQPGFDQFERFALVSRRCPEFQLTTIARLPVSIQIENHRDDPVNRPRMPVEMRLVKRTLRINREVSLKLK